MSCNWRQFTINSKDRVNLPAPNQFGGLSSTNSFTVRFNPIDLCKIRLKYVAIPNTIYNITTDNNIIAFNQGGPDLTASILPAAYSLSSLMAAIGTAMTSVSGGNTYLCSYDSSRFRLSIYEQTGAVNFRLLFGTYSSNSIAKAINWPLTDSSPIGQPSYTSPNALNLVSDMLYINIDRIGKYGQDTANNTYTFSIPANSNTNDSIIYTQNELYSQEINVSPNPIRFTDFTIELRDRSGQLVDLHNSNWIMVIEYA